MKLTLKTIAVPVLLCTLGSAIPMLAQNDGTNGPPKVLFIAREVVKPGKGGALHEKTEGAFLSALNANKAPEHYLGMNSITGTDRALFLSGYPSFAAMEEEHKSMGKIPGLEVALDRANVADGDLLLSTDESIWTRSDDLSYNPSGLTGDRYMEISEYDVKAGHGKEWEDLVKLVIDGYKKGVPSASWAMFEKAYGNGGSAYLVIWPLKSMADIDHNFATDKDFVAAMGKDGMKKLADLEASCLESHSTNLFAFNPKMSRVPDSWIKAEPDYWKPKVAIPVKKADAKPAQ
jgi:hypothetical protein